MTSRASAPVPNLHAMRSALGLSVRGVLIRAFVAGLLHALVGSVVARPLDLDQAIALALQNNPSVASAESATRAARARVGVARVGLLPRLQLDQSFSRSFVHATAPTPQLGGAVAGIPIVQYTSLERSNVSLSQLVTDFGRTRHRVFAARHAAHATKYGEYARRAQLVQDVHLAYTAVNLDQRLLAIARAASRVRGSLFEKVESGFKEGIRPRYDVGRARLDLQNAQLAVLFAEGELAREQFAFEGLLGVAGAGARPLVDDLDAPVVVPAASGLVEQALLRRPELQAAAAQVRVAQDNLASARAERYPSINSGGTYAHDDGTFGPGDAWSLAVVGSVPIFDGFQAQQDVRVARAQVDQAQADLRAEQLLVTQEVRTAILELEVARARLLEAGVLQARAQENIDLASGRYTEGVGSIIEVTDAQLNVTGANQAVAHAKADQQAAATRLARAAHLYPASYFPVHAPDEPAPPGPVTAPPAVGGPPPSAGTVSALKASLFTGR